MALGFKKCVTMSKRCSYDINICKRYDGNHLKLLNTLTFKKFVEVLVLHVYYNNEFSCIYKLKLSFSQERVEFCGDVNEHRVRLAMTNLSMT